MLTPSVLTGRPQGALEGMVSMVHFELRSGIIKCLCILSSGCARILDICCSLPGVFLWMGYTGTQFQVYDSCMRGSSSFSFSAGAAQSLVCGSAAGFAATVATYPLDIIRTVCAQHEAGASLSPRHITPQCHSLFHSTSSVCPRYSALPGAECKIRIY